MIVLYMEKFRFLKTSLSSFLSPLKFQNYFPLHQPYKIQVCTLETGMEYVSKAKVALEIDNKEAQYS